MPRATAKLHTAVEGAAEVSRLKSTAACPLTSTILTASWTRCARNSWMSPHSRTHGSRSFICQRCTIEHMAQDRTHVAAYLTSPHPRVQPSESVKLSSFSGPWGLNVCNFRRLQASRVSKCAIVIVFKPCLQVLCFLIVWNLATPWHALARPSTLWHRPWLALARTGPGLAHPGTPWHAWYIL